MTDGAKPRILVADDDETLRRLLAFILADDFDLVLVGDGAAALAALREQPFAGAVLDVMMPQLSGFEVTEAVRADPALVDLPIVLLTALDSDEDHARGRDAGCDAYLTKPFEPELLAATVALLLQPAAAGTGEDESESESEDERAPSRFV